MQGTIVKSRKQIETDALIDRFDEIMDFVEQTLSLWEIEKVWIEKMCLLVDEAVMNIIRYAYPDSAGSLRISILQAETAIQVDVLDQGIPFDPTMHPDPDVTLPLSERPVGGLGIHFMRKMLDVFQYRREGNYNHLTMKLNIRRGSSAFEQINRVDENPKALKVLLAVADTVRRKTFKAGLSGERFAITEVASRTELDLIVQQETGIELVLLDEGLVGEAVHEYAHRLKARQQVAYVYVIVITNNGAAFKGRQQTNVDDCIPAHCETKPLQYSLRMAARILDYEKRLLKQRLSHYEAMGNLWDWQSNVVAELSEASEYINVLLPAEQDHPVRIRWRFTPRSFLGGDLFGYHWMDDEHLLVYVVDACGHGFRAALFAMAVQNLLLSRIVPEMDRSDPSMILNRLNNAFPMDRFRKMYFSMWTGIYHRHSRKLTYSSGGHPPAVLVNNAVSENATPVLLTTNNVALGCIPDAVYDSHEISVSEGARLYAYTDGLTGNSKEDGSSMTRKDLTNLLMQYARNKADDNLLNQITRELYKGRMEDDFCLISIQF